MAQSRNTGSKSGSRSKKQPTSTARKAPASQGRSGAKNAGKGGTKSTAKGTARSGGKTNTRGSSSARSNRRTRRTKPIRREVGAVLLTFAGVLAIIALFPADGWLVNGYRALVSGLVGWGYYLAPAALMWAGYILSFHRGRPVAGRVTAVLLLPVLFGAFIHVILCVSDDMAVKHLWLTGQDMVEHCGGVFGGVLGILLRKALSKYGACPLLVVLSLLLCVKGMDLSLTAIIAAISGWFRERPKLIYEPEEDEGDDLIEDEDRLSPEDYLFPLNGDSPIRRAAEKARQNKRERDEARARERAEAETRRREQTEAEIAERVRAQRPRMYDEGWERQKDRLFAAMEIDQGAKLRVAAALRDEQKASRERQRTVEKAAEREARKKPAETAKPAPAPKPAAEDFTKDVTPLSMDDAAQIAGVEIQSANMDGGAASPSAGKKEKIDADAEAALIAQEIQKTEEEDKPVYQFPDISFLSKSRPGEDDGGSTEDGELQLEAAIRSYGVGASITGAVRGPSVTRYELKLDQGVKLSKIENLGKDIALSLGVEGVRIAPIPGKMSTVGVEVPNKKRATVYLGDLIDSEAFRQSKSKLSVAVGKDIAGNVVIGNIAKMPHVLIAGTTGSGKSVFVNCMILSILYNATPDEVRMIMIDPKQVEFVPYNGMPHLYVPVVNEAKKAAGALQWAVVEMLKRYRLFSEEGVRDLAGYNDVLRRQEQPILPQVVIFIDELADLMMVAAKEVEESICRLAQMGRAAGIHLVVATQSPRSDVITGLMKANIPSRIALTVANALESRIILDQQGAETLVGNGDMLFAPIGKKPLRVQGAWVTDEEREAVIDFIKQEAEAEYSDEILAEIEKAAADKNDKGGDESEDTDAQNDYDELLPQAVDVIFETKQASVSMLQRRLKLGYSRAARLIDQLEEVGVVGPYEGSKPRKIMLTKQQWQEMQYVQGTAPVDSIAAEFGKLSEDDAFAPVPEEDDEPAASGGEADILPDAGADAAPWEEDAP